MSNLQPNVNIIKMYIFLYEFSYFQIWISLKMFLKRMCFTRTIILKVRIPRYVILYPALHTPHRHSRFRSLKFLSNFGAINACISSQPCILNQRFSIVFGSRCAQGIMHIGVLFFSGTVHLFTNNSISTRNNA